MARCTTDPRPVLRDGAVYWADNGRRICARCAGASALYTGRDISGQKVERITIDDVQAWPDDLGPMRCEMGCTTLLALVGPDGWPLAKGGGR
jgi:hypothetical protein